MPEGRKKLVVEVAIKKIYLIDEYEERNLENLMNEWFKKFGNSSHAYRDGCEMYGIHSFEGYKVIDKIEV